MTTRGESLLVTILDWGHPVHSHINRRKMLFLWPSNLVTRDFLVVNRSCQESNGNVWAELTGIPTKHALYPKSGQVQNNWEVVPRGLIRKAERKPGLWPAWGGPKAQLMPRSNHPRGCKDGTAAIEGTCKCAIAVVIVSECLLD